MRNRRCVIITPGHSIVPNHVCGRGFCGNTQAKTPRYFVYDLNRDLWDLGITGIDVKCVLRGDAAHSQGGLRITGMDVKPKVLAWKSDSGLDASNRCVIFS